MVQAFDCQLSLKNLDHLYNFLRMKEYQNIFHNYLIFFSSNEILVLQDFLVKFTYLEIRTDPKEARKTTALTLLTFFVIVSYLHAVMHSTMFCSGCN